MGTDVDLAILGPIGFIVFAIASGLWIRALRRLLIPKDRSAYVVAWAAAGTLGVLALMFGDGGALFRVPAWIAATAGPFLLFTVAISRQVPGVNAITVGDPIPPFSARDEHGQRVDSASFHGHLVLIKFFRAHW